MDSTELIFAEEVRLIVEEWKFSHSSFEAVL